MTAQAAAEQVAGEPALPMQGGATAARRLTGARLMQRMRRDPNVRRRLSNLRLVPPDGERTLRAIADLIAASPDGDAFVFGGDLCPGGLAEEVAVQRKLSGPADAFVATIESLQRAELIRLEDGAVRLVLPPEVAVATVRDADGNVVAMPGQAPSAGGRIGRPRAGESADAYQARLARARAEAQRNPGLPLRPMVLQGGRTSATDFGGLTPEHKSGESPDFGGTESPAGKVPMSGLPPASRAAAAASEQMTYKNKSDLAAAVAARAREDFSESPDLSDAATYRDALDAPDQATQLAALFAHEWRFGDGAADEAWRIIRVWMRSGIPGALIRGVFDEAAVKDAGRAINGIRYFRDRVLEAVEAARVRGALVVRQEGAAPEAAGPPAPDVRIEDDPGCPAELRVPWRQVRERLLRELGAVEYTTWFRRLGCLGFGDDGLRLTLPTRFIVDHVRTEFGDRMLQVWREEAGDPGRLDFQHAAVAVATG